MLLNKVDLIDADQQKAAVDLYALIIRPCVPILPTTFSQVPDLDWILDGNCYDVDRAKEVERGSFSGKEK